jgi:hypothetical protein
MRFAVFSIVFLVPALVIARQHSSSSATAKPTHVADLCKPGSLPKDIQSHLKERYSSWKVQEPDYLNSNARERWESEKPLQCPGIAMGHFDSADATSYAVLLTSQSRTGAGAGYKFIIFSPNSRQQSYTISFDEQVDEDGSGNFFIHRVSISKFFDENSKKRFQVQSSEAILLVGSAEKQYGAEVYFLAKSGYKHEPVDY